MQMNYPPDHNPYMTGELDEPEMIDRDEMYDTLEEMEQ
jgi:hypothetical protein